MLELMMFENKGIPEDTGDVLYLYDPVTNTDLAGQGFTTALTGGAVSAPDYLINGQGSVRFPTDAARILVTLPTPMDLSATNWTLEWSSINDSAPTDYAGEMWLYGTTANRGLFFRYGNSGFLNRLHLANLGAAPADTWATPYTKANLVGLLSNWALVQKNGVISIYRNGIRVPIAKGEQNTLYLTQGFTPTATLITINSIRFGDQNSGTIKAIPGYHGRIRLSNFARYTRNYTPQPLTM